MRDSEFVGAVKERLVLPVSIGFTKTVLKRRDGTPLLWPMYVVRMTTDDGDKLVWFASKDPGWPVSTKLRLKMTIQEHSEYRGVKETRVSRCVLVKS